MALVVSLWIVVGTLALVPVVVSLEVEGEAGLARRVTRMWLVAMSTVTSIAGGGILQQGIEFLMSLW